MARLLRIENCGECPHANVEWGSRGQAWGECTKVTGSLGGPKPIPNMILPDWCPLEEAASEDRS